MLSHENVQSTGLFDTAPMLSNRDLHCMKSRCGVIVQGGARLRWLRAAACMAWARATWESGSKDHGCATWQWRLLVICSGYSGYYSGYNGFRRIYHDPLMRVPVGSLNHPANENIQKAINQLWSFPHLATRIFHDVFVWELLSMYSMIMRLLLPVKLESQHLDCDSCRLLPSIAPCCCTGEP